jgi:hypothetical protein
MKVTIHKTRFGSTVNRIYTETMTGLWVLKDLVSHSIGKSDLHATDQDQSDETLR